MERVRETERGREMKRGKEMGGKGRDGKREKKTEGMGDTETAREEERWRRVKGTERGEKWRKDFYEQVN